VFVFFPVDQVYSLPADVNTDTQRWLWFL